MRVLFLIALSLALAACGFQLRGTAALPFESLYLDVGDNPPLLVELKRGIIASGNTRLSDNPAEAQAVLKILGESTEKRILSLSGAGRVNEYQLFYRLSFQLYDGKKRDLIAPQQIELKRDFTFSDAQLLAKESEERLLLDNMRSDAVIQLLRRLGAVKLQPPQPQP